MAAAVPRSAPRVVSAHQVSVDSLDAGATTREMTRASARSRSGQTGPSSAGSPSLTAMACAGGDVPVRQRPQDRRCLRGGDQRGAFQRRLDRVGHGFRQPGQVGQRLVLDPGAVAVGAPQVPGLVFVPLAFLVGVAAADPGHVHRRRLCCHDPHDIG